MSKKETLLLYGVYLLLSLAVMGALLAPGFIMTLDSTYALLQDFRPLLYGLDETWIWAGLPFYLLTHLAGKLAPVWLTEKLILILILFLAGLGAHRLLPQKGIGSYFCGLLYMINPFTYVRFLAGQWDVLAAYALVPFAVRSFIELLDKPGIRKAITMALLSTFVGMIEVQGFFLLFLAFLVIFMVRVITERARIIHVAKYVGVGAISFLSLNAYWLVPSLTAGESVLKQIGGLDLFAFAPRAAASPRVMFDLASMHGFWRDGYLYVSDVIPAWWLLFGFVLFLAIYGFVCYFREKETGRLAVSFAVIGVIGFLMALGAVSAITKPLFQWLWDHVFFFRGFRDSHKFISLLCLSYSFLGGLGVGEFSKVLPQLRGKIARSLMMALIVVGLLTPLVYSFPMFGLHGQLGVTYFPTEWYRVNEYLARDGQDFNVLVLPWHAYMDYSWLPNRDKRLANPARKFFNKPVIQGDNIEIGSTYPQSANPISGYIEFLLLKRSEIRNLGELLAPLNVKYVILAKEADYELYDFLYRQEDLKPVLEEPGITLFKNEYPIARVYAVNSLVHIRSLDEYLELSKEQDVMSHLYIIGSGLSDDGSAQMEKLNFTAKSPVKYQVEGTSQRYTIFTLPQNVSANHWEYNGRKALKNLGFMPAFESSDYGGEVVYTRFYRVYLPSCFFSGVALAVVLGLSMPFRRWSRG